MASAVDDFQRALELFSAGNLPEAVRVCRRVLAVEPEHPRALHMLGRVLLDEGKVAEARSCLERARELDPLNPSILVACGRLSLYDGQFDEALAVLNEALAREPDSVEAHHYLALVLQSVGKLDAAEKEARTALARQPRVPELLDSLGVILVRRGEYAEAERYFEEALAAAPEHPGAIWQLALWHEQMNRIAEAERLAQRGLELYPDDAALRFVLARCQRRRKQYDSAHATLLGMGRIATVALRKDVEYELALCCEGLQKADQAMEHASRANALVCEHWPQAVLKAQEYSALVENLKQRFTPQWVATWTALPEANMALTPAFLVGFPRSGTTLLDTMLGAHPDLRVLEEPPTLQALVGLAGRMPRGYPDALADMSAADRNTLAASYDAVVPARTGSKGTRILDKNPLGSVHLGLIRRVFGDTPVLFMVRHPCDVVLSCFLTNFDLNPGTANFFRLSTTVEFYCRVMELWQGYQRVLRTRVETVRYEDLMAEPEATLRRVLSFMGLSWVPEVLSHTAQAAMRGRINSASYAQVTEPLYRRGQDRWRRYTGYLEPYFRQLQPWCDLFGYDL